MNATASAPRLQLSHFGLRTRNLEEAVRWYGAAFGARVQFANDIAAFMTFDDEHHRFVLWDDGDTEQKGANASGVDHVGFGCAGPEELADEYERLKALGMSPTLCVNHHFTSSLYYRDPDGNEVEITCDNFPTKAAAEAFMRSPALAEVMEPPFFGSEFDPHELARLRHEGASRKEMARVGLT